MGSNYSLDVDKLDDSNEFLNRLCGSDEINENDPFWNQFLSFNNTLKYTKETSEKFKYKTDLLCSTWTKFNLQTRNFSTLVRVYFKLFDQMKDMPDNVLTVNQLQNTLLILRSYLQYCVSINESFLLEQIFNENDPNFDFLTDLIMCTCELIIQIPTTNYFLHLEALNLLLVLLSVQMSPEKNLQDGKKPLIYENFMFKLDERLISDLVQALLENIIKQDSLPTIQQHNKTNLMSSFWSIMTLGYSTSQSNKDDASQETINYTDRLLALQSCHILLILSNYCTNDITFRNPFRLALFHFTDTQDYPTNIPNSEPLAWFSVDYTKLYNVFCQTMHSDQYTLLLYMLLHRNQHFKMFILSRLNIDQLVVPLLKVIYTKPDKNSHHIYMALIIILILSEDDLFNKSIHSIMLKNPTWYTERNLTEISLGGLLILIVIRTIQYNITRMRDKYLHTNCLAALANMSSKYTNLHSYVCQRLNSLFGLLAKKHEKLLNQINEDRQRNHTQIAIDYDNDCVQDLSTLEELMRMVLEIINSCLTNALHHNSNLVYSLLYNKHIYQQFCSHEAFQDVLTNIDIVINFFSNEVEILEDRTLERVKETIEKGIKQFSRDRLKKLPELKFKYVEEDQPEDFFVPYVWSMIYEHSHLLLEGQLCIKTS